MYSVIVKELLGRDVFMEPAVLKDYRRCKIIIKGRQAKGPAIILSPGNEVHGQLLRNLSERELKIINLYEDAASGYLRVIGEVRTAGGKQIRALFYTADNTLSAHLSEEDWSPEEFEEKYLEYYLTNRIPQLQATWTKTDE